MRDIVVKGDFYVPDVAVAKTNSYNSNSRQGVAQIEADFHDEWSDSSAQSQMTNPAMPEVRTRIRASRSTPVPSEDRVDAGDSFLRARRRVPVRRGLWALWAGGRWARLTLLGLILLLVGLLVWMVLAVRHYFDHSPEFLINSSALILTTGNNELSRGELLNVFGADIGRNLFYVPLARRAAELEQIPWVRHATVMRILPNEIRVSVIERQPIAFLRVGSNISLIDDQGVVLTMSPQLMARHHFNFPVLTGIDPESPLADRAERIALYQRFLAALHTIGPHVADQISEIDLADPEDVRATFSYGGHELLLHFGYTNFATRYRNYITHITAWEQEYPHLASIDLRYDDQVVLRMATPSTPAPNVMAAAAQKAQPHKAVAHRASRNARLAAERRRRAERMREIERRRHPHRSHYQEAR